MELFRKDLQAIRQTRPLVHNITNYVVMNNTANALLALGASPVMAHAVEEVSEFAQIAGSLVINMGTLSQHWVAAMEIAAEAAHQAGVPIVIDPVGVGATSFRNQTILRLLSSTKPQIIRGNGSEISATASLLKACSLDSITKGVDSTASSESALEAAQWLSSATGAVVVISGPIDYIVSGPAVFNNQHGTPIMSYVTGMGCTASAICGAFAAVNSDMAQAALHAMQVMGICGERTLAKVGERPGSFQVTFLDELYAL